MHPADRAIRDMIAERDREIKKLNEELRRAGKVIQAADGLYKASQQIPTAGFQPNRDLAEAAKEYKVAKDIAKGEQEHGNQ